MKKILQVIIFISLAVLIAIIPFLFQGLLMPGELTKDHSSLQCNNCHDPWEGAQDPECMTCHENKNIHWHNNSVIQGGCRSCHQLHRDEPKKTDSNCSSCHMGSHETINFSESDCTSCHVEPGQIRLDHTYANPDVEKLMEKDDHEDGKDCYLCHDQKNFDEYNCLTQDCHGTNKYDNKHEDESEDWKTTDCFEPGCHSKKDRVRDPVDNSNVPMDDFEEKQDLVPDEYCLVFIVLIGSVLFFLGYIYIIRVMEK